MPEPPTKKPRLDPSTGDMPKPIFISIPIEDEDESIVAQKTQILQKFKVDHEKQVIGGNSSDEHQNDLSEDLLCAVRVCHMTDIELYFFEAEKMNPKKQIISAYNEMRSFLFLKRHLSAMMKSEEQRDENEVNILKRCYQSVVDHYTLFVTQNQPKHVIVNSNDASEDSMEEEKRMKKFLEWANENQIEHSKVAVADFECFGKGLAAVEDLTNDQVIITISRKLLLCVKTALESESVGPIFVRLKEELQLDEDSLITLFIMYEKGNPDTKWKPYFDILPQTLPTYPLYFSDEALERLQGTPLYIEVMQTKDQLKDFHDSIFPVLFEHFPDVFKQDVFTYENLVWTRAIVDTRAFSFRDMGCCMLPFVDFVNTFPYPQLESKGSYIAELDAFQLKTFANVKKGDQLFICYGPYSNRELLQYYGFITQNNTYDRYYIDFEMPETDSQKIQDQKLALLKKFHLSLDHFFHKGPIPSKMIAALRIALMNEQELKRALKGAKWTPFTPKSNDDIVVQTLQVTLDALINMLNADSTNDQASLTENEMIALQYKASQLDVLTESLCHVKHLL